MAKQNKKTKRTGSASKKTGRNVRISKSGSSKKNAGAKDGHGKRGPRKRSPYSRRDSAKYPGLNKGFFSRIKQEYHDIDYAHKLTDKEKEFLSSFMEEDLGARFNHKRKKIYKKVADKRASYRRNNHRNYDMYSIAKASKRNIDIATDRAFELWQDRYLDMEYEDRLISEIEDARSLEEYLIDKDKIK